MIESGAGWKTDFGRIGGVVEQCQEEQKEC